MPFNDLYRPAHAFAELGPTFSDPVTAADFPKTLLRYRNDRAAESVGLDTLTDAEWIEHFGRFAPLPDGMEQPRALRYHGHQFRHYNPDLGDGRGFLFAQLRSQDGRLLDLSTKGSGQTPYSRAGDGRLTLKGAVREVLATAMLELRGVSTSKTFSLIETGEALMRGDEPSPTRSAVLVRLSHSHLRFGVFQRHAFHRDEEAIATLIDHVADHYISDIVEAPCRAAALMGHAVRNMARLTAQWMVAGFVHGVLNTDNVTVMGESFDYGPYRFLPAFEPGFTAAYFDHSGLYAFARQPEAAFWNCRALAASLSLVTEEEGLVAALREFEDAYQDALRIALFTRLGILPGDDPTADLDFVRETYSMLERTKQAWEPFFHRWFGGRASDADAAEGEIDWALRLRRYEPDRPGRLSVFDGPCDLLYEEIEAIWAAIDERDDWQPLHDKLTQIETRRVALSRK